MGEELHQELPHGVHWVHKVADGVDAMADSGRQGHSCALLYCGGKVPPVDAGHADTLAHANAEPLQAAVQLDAAAAPAAAVDDTAAAAGNTAAALPADAEFAASCAAALLVPAVSAGALAVPAA